MTTESIVDGLLRRYGFSMELNPYRVVEILSGRVVMAGPAFDFSYESLKRAKASCGRLEASKFKKGS